MSRVMEFWTNDDNGKLNTLSFFRFWFDMVFLIIWIAMESTQSVSWEPSSGITMILLVVNGLVPAATLIERIGLAKVAQIPKTGSSSSKSDENK